jgi:hypothetical protein
MVIDDVVTDKTDVQSPEQVFGLKLHTLILGLDSGHRGLGRRPSPPYYAAL